MSGGVEQRILELRNRYVARLGEKLDALDAAVRDVCQGGGAARASALAVRVREDASGHGFDDLGRICQELHDLLAPFAAQAPPAAVRDGAALLVHQARAVLHAD